MSKIVIVNSCALNFHILLLPVTFGQLRRNPVGFRRNAQPSCPSRQCVGMLSEGHGVVNYGCINFTYEGKQQEEFIEWLEKRIDDEIARYLQRHLQSKSAKPADVLRVQAVAGGDHGDTAFQFGASGQCLKD